MSKYKYECVIEQKSICNEDSVFPAMKELVNGGMSVKAAAKFVEEDSKGQVTLNRARAVYRRRSKGVVAGHSLKQRKTVKAENDNVFVKWNLAVNECLDFGSKILNKEVSWKTKEERKVVQDCFKSIDGFLKLFVDKVRKGKIPL